MLITLIIISWVIFGTMAAFMLFYTRDQRHQVLGITLAYNHQKEPEIQELLKRYKLTGILVFLLSVGLSFLLLLADTGLYAEFILLILLLVNLLLNGLTISRYQHKLRELKKEKGWIYRQSRIVTVDLNVIKEKGKAGLSPVWVWLFFLLSFLPIAYLLFVPEIRMIYPIGFSLIGPLCQLSTVFIYYLVLRSHTPAISENTEINKAYARTLERIRTVAATLSGLSLLVFWFLFNFVILAGKPLFLIILVVILLAALLGIAIWQQKKTGAAENYFFSTEIQDEDNIYEQDAVYKWGFYYNPNDPRLLVPKRIASMGWTFNIAHPAGKFIGLSIIVLVLGVFTLLFYSSVKDYVIAENGSQIIIDAPMYDFSFEKNQVVSVYTLESLPPSMRTNGYGGVSKSFGHFSVEGYGKCLFYVYRHGGGYIVLKLEGDNPGYVIVNGKTQDETEALYRSFQQWLSK